MSQPERDEHDRLIAGLSSQLYQMLDVVDEAPKKKKKQRKRVTESDATVSKGTEAKGTEIQRKYTRDSSEIFMDNLLDAFVSEEMKEEEKVKEEVSHSLPCTPSRTRSRTESTIPVVDLGLIKSGQLKTKQPHSVRSTDVDVDEQKSSKKNIKSHKGSDGQNRSMVSVLVSPRKKNSQSPRKKKDASSPRKKRDTIDSMPLRESDDSSSGSLLKAPGGWLKKKLGMSSFTRAHVRIIIEDEIVTSQVIVLQKETKALDVVLKLIKQLRASQAQEIVCYWLFAITTDGQVHRFDPDYSLWSFKGDDATLHLWKTNNSDKSIPWSSLLIKFLEIDRNFGILSNPVSDEDLFGFSSEETASPPLCGNPPPSGSVPDLRVKPVVKKVSLNSPQREESSEYHIDDEADIELSVISRNSSQDGEKSRNFLMRRKSSPNTGNHRKLGINLGNVRKGKPLSLRGGSNAVVYNASVDGWSCVMKEVVTDYPDDAEAILNEIKVLEKLPVHPNVVRYLFHEQDQLILRLYLSKYDEDLHSYIAKQRDEGVTVFPFSFIHKVLLDVVTGLGFLHKHKIIHRDIKSENIFLELDGDGVNNCVIGDLDTAKVLSKNERPMTVRGTPSFIAPEVLTSEDSIAYNTKADVYSLGMLLYELLSLSYPYGECRGVAQISAKILSGEIPDLPSSLPRELQPFCDLYIKCTHREADKRPTAKHVLRLLKAMQAAGGSTRKKVQRSFSQS